jgi:hypothetical protein
MANRTLGDICMDASALLDDPRQDRYPLVQLRRWANEGSREASKLTGCLRASADVDWNADDQTNTLTQDIVSVIEAEWINDNDDRIWPLVYRDHTAGRPIWGTHQAISVGYPSVYWTDGYPGALDVSLYPTPTQNGTLRLRYARFSTSLATNGAADGTAIDLPAGWEDAVVEWICDRARQSTREYDIAQAHKGAFDGQLEALATIAVRYADETGSIAMDDWYDIFGDGWG